MFVNQKICAGLLGLALTAVMGQAAEPTIDYSLELKLAYTGTLYSSTDGVNWTRVEGASNPYYVPIEDAKKLFFCSKDELDQPPVPGDDFNTPLSGGVDLGMNWIEPGTFMMGSPEGELGADGDEILHQVTLTSGYWLGKYEVTQAQYEAVMGENPSRFKGADLPVENVSWEDAMAFCEKLTAQERAEGRLSEAYEYTLPTEAQWEYACRAGTTTAFNNGTNIETEDEIYGKCPNLDEVGWYKYNSDDTHPAGQKKPNAWGLYDMHGNVWEWCLDRKSSYPTEAVTDPVGEGTDDYRALRGGSYDYYRCEAKDCRSAARRTGSTSMTSSDLGFRVALVRTGSKNILIPLAKGVNLNMVWIEPGTFMMGSPKDELGGEGESTEIQHQVKLTQGYWLGKYEVTQAQYEAVTGTNPSFGGADLPVTRVSWYDAMAFCVKLTLIERAAGRLPVGYEYTLPTEAQWEYACRAGTTTALNSGKDLSDKYECPEMDEVGWYKYNSGYYNSDGYWMPEGKNHPVGQKQPNAWGLYDMHGNVQEWCLDWYRGLYLLSGEAIDPVGITGTERVLRGGSWSELAFGCRSAYRYYQTPSYLSMITGFRVALAPMK